MTDEEDYTKDPNTRCIIVATQPPTEVTNVHIADRIKAVLREWDEDAVVFVMNTTTAPEELMHTALNAPHKVVTR